MAEEFGQRRCEFLGQFVLRCYEVHKRPERKKDRIEQNKQQFGDGSSMAPALVKVLIQHIIEHQLGVRMSYKLDKPAKKIYKKVNTQKHKHLS